MARTPESLPYVKGLYICAVDAGKYAEGVLKTEETSEAEREGLRRIIMQGERAKECLRELGVKNY